MRSMGLVLSWLVFFAVFSSPTPIWAQDPVRVTLQLTFVDAMTGQPLQDVSVAVEDLGLKRTSGSTGVLILADVPLGAYSLMVQREGYETESGHLTVERDGEMLFRLKPVDGPGAAEMSRVQGRVRSAGGGPGLEGVLVRFVRLGLARETDSNGRFSFQDVPPGEHALTAEFLGYSPREVSLNVETGTILTIELTLAVDPIELDPIEVSVEARSLDLELAGFYGRRAETSGYFITRERIEERAPLYTTDLFRGVAGIKVMGGLGMGTQNAVVLSGARGISFSSGPCFPTVWMDGLMVHKGTGGGMPGQEGPAFVDQLIHPDEIAGIEIYNSPASMPVQYNLHSACGAIIFWTRHGR